MAQEEHSLRKVWSVCAWISVGSTLLLSLICFITGSHIGDRINRSTGYVKLPLISKVSMSGLSVAYFIPCLLLIWLIVVEMRGLGASQLRILTVGSFAFGLLLLGFFACGVALPLTHYLFPSPRFGE